MNLLPCPFCGGTNVKLSLSRDCDYLAVVCFNDDCMAEGPSTWPKDIWDKGTPERAKAIELWNTRAVTLTPVHE
jgi:Lar family restriction alleviation protein